jgi:DNA-nicking Smr family endonuclease
VKERPFNDPRRRLHDLANLRDELQRHRREMLDRAAAGRAARKPHEHERPAFATVVGPVTPLAAHGRVEPVASPTPPLPRQRERDEQQALRESMSDGLDGDALLETDESLSFRRPHVGPDVVRKLRRGHWAIQAELDLHGLNRDAARARLADFIRQAQRRGLRCVRVVHGKGHGSPGKTPVLKGRVQRWLTQRQEVSAYTQARAADGGAGAVVVLLAAGTLVSG